MIVSYIYIQTNKISVCLILKYSLKLHTSFVKILFYDSIFIYIHENSSIIQYIEQEQENNEFNLFCIAHNNNNNNDKQHILFTI